MAEALQTANCKNHRPDSRTEHDKRKKIQFFIWIKNRIFDTILYIMKKVTTNAHYICKITS